MKQKKLVIATGNRGKLKEFAKLLAALNVQVLALADFLEIGEIAENGLTFKDNALIKGRVAAAHTGLISLADDSGLEVDFLHGQPGVNSARFAGEQRDDKRNNEKLLKLLKGTPPAGRTARFKCVIAVVTPAGQEFTVEGNCEGLILEKEKGAGGFGYDPLFYVPEYGQTFAQLDLEIKNEISHRGKAVRQAMAILQELFKSDV
ncbi:MAG: XTP/dITP diphosphatase [Peptococcaceae bacterium]